MSDDLLDRATRALRETSEPDPIAVQRTRRRVLESLEARERRRFRLLPWFWPLAALLFGTTAWAATTGRLDSWVAGWRDAETAEATRPMPSTPESVRTRSPEPSRESEGAAAAENPSADAPATESTSELDARSSVAATRDSSSTRRERVPPRSNSSVGPSNDAPADPRARELAAFRHANALHADRGQPSRALEAWNDFLRAHPNGIFAAEARYNRALCLVRLGRKDEARRALAPFAAGQVEGGYREDDARALLDVLSD